VRLMRVISTVFDSEGESDHLVLAALFVVGACSLPR
jgi:hypothetical protein